MCTMHVIYDALIFIRTYKGRYRSVHPEKLQEPTRRKASLATETGRISISGRCASPCDTSVAGLPCPLYHIKPQRCRTLEYNLHK